MNILLAHLTGADTTMVVTAFVLGLVLGAALLLSVLRRSKTTP